MLEEKLEEAVVAELKRQAANDHPQSLCVDNADDLAMVIVPSPADRSGFYMACLRPTG